MSFISRTSLALTSCALLLSGCAVPAVKTSQSTQTLQGVTSNWQFIPIDDFYHMDKLGGLAGALATQGTNVTAVSHGSGCVDPSTDIMFSGTEDAKGDLTLTSTNLPNNVATITGPAQTLTSGVYIQSGLTVTGSGPCTSSWPIFPGNQYQPLNGGYTANLKNSNSATATLTANFTAGATNADGEIPETGTLTLATLTCSSSFSFTGTALGANLQGTLSTSAGSANGVTLSVLLNGAVSIASPSGSCAAGSFSGTLTSTK